jgi:integrase
MKPKNYSITPLWRRNAMDAKTKQAPVVLNIILNKKEFRITLKLRCTKAEFNAALSTRSASAKELRLQLMGYVDKAEKVMERLPQPTKESFTRLFKSDTDLFTSNKTDVFYFFDMKVEEVTKEGRMGTASYYKQCKVNLQNFKSSVYFEEIDEKFLKEYQAWLRKRGNSVSTVSLRMRCLRIMFNYAAKSGFISNVESPYRNFNMGTTTRSKKVLYPVQIKQFWEYEPKTLREERAKDYFFFSFLCNGMNFKDMAYLKRKQITGDIITFVREKTKNTTHETNEIQVYLHDEVKRILNKWGNKDLSPESYLFPILPAKFKTVEYDERTRAMRKRRINKSLHAIGKKLGLEFNLTIGLARHSFATTLKLNGTNVSFISEMLGHTSMKTTMHYLKSIPSNERKVVSDSLLSFAV